MNIPLNTTVLIIGGGPAGAMAAAMLAKQNIEVIVLEKQSFPRYTVGESLIPHFWKFTDQIGVSEKIEREGFIRKGGGAAYWNGTLRKIDFSKYGHTRPGLHVERDRFDQILLDRAKELGATVFEQIKVKKADLINPDWRITYLDLQNEKEGMITCQYLIDASGQNAVISKQMGYRTFDDDFKFQAFWAYFDKSDYLDSNGKVETFENRFTKPPMSLTSGTGDWGWAWHLVMKDRVSVGTVVPKSKLEAFKKGGAELISRFLNQTHKIPLTEKLLKGSQLISKVRTIRDYAYQPTKLAFDNCFLIGDAAAFADPINSEGVTLSMYGGLLAAWAIEQSLNHKKRKDFFRQFYIESLHKRFQVFQLLSYPSHQIPDKLLESCKRIIANQSPEESQLILAHLILVNRANDFPELLKGIKLPHKDAVTALDYDFR